MVVLFGTPHMNFKCKNRTASLLKIIHNNFRMLDKNRKIVVIDNYGRVGVMTKFD